MKKLLSCCLFSLLAVALGQQTKHVSGAAVSGVSLENGKVEVTILNQSGQPITYWMIRLKEHLNDGRENNFHAYGEDAELAPGEMAKESLSDDNHNIESVESAEVIFAVYSDRTVQVKDGEEARFEEWQHAQREFVAQFTQRARDMEAKGDSEGARQYREQAKRLSLKIEARRIP
jgi:hypothetical protein